MFILSKLLAAGVQPATWCLLVACFALWIIPRYPRLGARLIGGALVVMVLLGFPAIPDALLRLLENRYPAPSDTDVQHHAGAIVLGGAIDSPVIFLAHGQVPTNDSAERLWVPLQWLNAYPSFKLVYSGGEGRLLAYGVSEASLAKQFYLAQGIAGERLILEEKSRNTRENARFVAALEPGVCAGDWLLVTSAWHMPRAMAEFDAAGCRVTPYPVDFRTGARLPWLHYSLVEGLYHWQMVMHEGIGIAVAMVMRFR